MRVFVLCTGRCGSLTFANALGDHVKNFTVAHESGGYVDWSYPDCHIEIDNRLSWFLGSLARNYVGGDVYFVHLRRRQLDVIASYAKRSDSSTLMRGYADLCQRNFPTGTTAEQFACHLVGSMLDNIYQFFQTLPPYQARLTIDLEKPDRAFRELWKTIGAVGDFDGALQALKERHNES